MQRFGILIVLAGFVATGITCAPPADPGKKQVVIPPIEKDKKGISAPPMGLQRRVEAALDHVRKRDLLTSHSFWTVFHAILGMGWADTELLDESKSTRVKAIDVITQGGPMKGLSFLQKGDGLDVETMVGTGTGQGHQDQFVAEMAQWDLPASTRFKVNGKDFTFADFHKYSKFRASTKANPELSWAIVIIAQYYGTDAKWRNERGEDVTLEECVAYEVKEPVDTAACGGTHRLFGITWALHYHLKNGGKKTGVWKDADDHLQKYVDIAKKTQNMDGSFSTNYLAGKASSQELGARISTSGHVFEWLALVLPDSELKADWMQNAANAVALMILETRSDPVEGGALYHAAHGLQIYRDRVFGPPDRKDYHGPLIPLPPK